MIFTDITDPDQVKFLLGIAQYGTMRLAAEKSGVPLHLHHKWVAKDVSGDYRRAYNSAQSMAVMLVEDEAWRRGVEGVDEDVYQGGELVGSKRVYDSSLLKLWLQGNAPDKYGNQINVGKNNEIKITMVDPLDD